MIFTCFDFFAEEHYLSAVQNSLT